MLVGNGGLPKLRTREDMNAALVVKNSAAGGGVYALRTVSMALTTRGVMATTRYRV
jgi:hypothetical protein